MRFNHFLSDSAYVMSEDPKLEKCGQRNVCACPVSESNSSLSPPSITNRIPWINVLTLPMDTFSRAGTVYPSVKFINLWEMVKNINMFVFATDLTAKKPYRFGSILFAKVYSGTGSDLSVAPSSSVGEWTRSSDENNLITRIENCFAPPLAFSSLAFAVLGMEQKAFFESIWPDSPLTDVSDHVLPTLDDDKSVGSEHLRFRVWRTGWNILNQTFFRARRIEMYRNVISELAPSPDMLREIVIPERRKHVLPLSEDDVSFCRDVLKIKLLIDAVGLEKKAEKKSSPKHEWKIDYAVEKNEYENISEEIPNYTYMYILVAPVCERHDDILHFRNLTQLFDYVNKHYSDDCVYIGVIGKQMQKFWEDVCRAEDNLKMKFVNISWKIPNDIDYICRNVKHANYHARRIEALKVKLSDTYGKRPIFPWKLSRNFLERTSKF